ncbi:protein timeless homolog [Balaenoptera musculus]|uniref:Protein timeless homolog n=1 Tax=Balaenoptera musculus TaxID=9771 RepID=A0A8B8YNA7_BALMU|nr:protein timeless homolog [Balaenoptera musculus]XP_036723325.1 protein timeless homolog [Balaenoptera musculus]XP_036723326.1 protein timeless homolog [Balaenoptera musculus]XP_036723327.1 protein timeless homolog [Balaenoptera musculus]XP_036723328.1 protein timeless homolog [Balaenoptera musculus]XP_036723329.1 protein timeless homolog [Balaenoptera musculus]
MDLNMMNCELLATCSALGYLEGDTYHKEPDCLESVKDLIRYLRHEDETRDVRQQLGAAQILQSDLLPILTQHRQDQSLFHAVIRLMVNLTQPALLCFGSVPKEPSFRHHFLQVLAYLQAYKEAFASEKAFGVLSETLYELLQLGWEERQEEDSLLIERILLLVRNVLHVPADLDQEKRIDDDASVHDRLLWAIHLSGLDDLLLFLASATAEHQWSLHVLEIISLMFRDQNPEQLAGVGQGRLAQERRTAVAELEVLRQREMAEKKTRALQRGNRHSRFGGSYIVQGLKSIGERDLIFHKGLHNLQNYTSDLGKQPRRVPKRRQAARELSVQRRSALNVRLFLRDFCSEFLENCYNRLMGSVKDHLLREKAQQHDETYYMWALAFFMAFNRAASFRPGLVSETLSVRTFHFIEQNLTKYYEMMLTDRKEATSWARRMHLALKAYQELLATVNEMNVSPDEAVRESSRIIQNNIFYVMEYRELFLALFRKFDERCQPRSFLRDLVETTHLFLKMLERFCRSRGNLMVQNKRKKRKKKKKVLDQSVASGNVPYSPEEMESVWPSLAEQLQCCAQDSELSLDSMVPFDAASEVPVEEQRAEAMVRIQDCLLAGQAPQALTLLRSAREVWPEGDVFGSQNISPEEEIQLLKQIFWAPLPRQQGPEEQGAEEEDEEEEEEEELHVVEVLEKEFNFLDYLKRFANSTVIQAYVLLLRSYKQNSAHTNHCVVKMLHRLAYDLKMEALLFQLSLFCLFNRMLSDPAAGAYKELVTFAKYILGKFFALAAVNQKAFVELLFWKNTAVVREMTEGYGSLDGGSSSRRRPVWSPEEEAQLQELYLAHKDVEGQDVVDTILAHLKTAPRTRKQVIHHLVQLGLADSVKDFQRKGTQIVLWTEDQELELQRLFEEFQDSDDVLGNIMKNITAKRSRARIVDKLLALGLVAERRELYKKRQKKLAPSSLPNEEESLNDFCQEDLEEEENLPEEESEEDEEKEEGSEAEQAHGGSILSTQNLGQNLHQEGFSAPLLWLQNCLIRAAEDREEVGCSQAVPLVPLTEENEEAMENEQFQQLLQKLRVRPPASGQETFWRIPAKLSPTQLRRMAASLSQPEEEEKLQPGLEPKVPAEQGPEEEHQQEEAHQQEEERQKEHRAHAPRALLSARKKKAGLVSPEEEGTDGGKEQLKVAPKKRQLLDSDEEKEEDEGGSKAPELGAPGIRKKKRFQIEDDDESD